MGNVHVAIITGHDTHRVGEGLSRAPADGTDRELRGRGHRGVAHRRRHRAGGNQHAWCGGACCPDLCQPSVATRCTMAAKRPATQGRSRFEYKGLAPFVAVVVDPPDASAGLQTAGHARRHRAGRITTRAAERPRHAPRSRGAQATTPAQTVPIAS